MTTINSRYFPSLSALTTGLTGSTSSSNPSSGLNASALGGMGSSDFSGLGDLGSQFEKAIASAFAEALVNVITQNPEIASSLTQALGGTDSGSTSSVPASTSGVGSGGSGTGTGTGATGTTADTTGALGTDGVGGSDQTTKDGYTVQDCVRDMQKLQSQNKNDGGGPQRSAAELLPIAKGIIKGINDNFSNQPGAKMAHALIASAWSESRFNTSATNGGVFQCAQNRLDDYNKAHGTHYTEAQLSVASGGDASKAIEISLWAMAHPDTQGLKTSMGGVQMPTDAGNKALYLWNYNPAEIAKYMQTTGYSQSLLNSGD